MSYDIHLVDPVTRKTILFDTPHQMHGGTFAFNGTREAWLNITYNYSTIFMRVLGNKGIREIYGLTGVESISILNTSIAKLNDDVDDNYWKATDGNAKQVLLQLRAMAQLRPDGVWDGD